MAERPTNPLVRYIRSFTEVQQNNLLSDRELLRRFATNQDQAAFTALVRRHGAMVLRVCRRVLRHGHDAEDAFQATFMVLSRQAASRRWHDSIDKWLYKVAHRVALETRTAALRRQARESQVDVQQLVDPRSAISLHDAEAVLNEELERLPESLRMPLVLCCLEGQTNRRAAQQLGCSEKTIGRRISRARELLRSRLASRGIALSTALLMSGLAREATAAELPALLVGPTVRAAAAFAAHQRGLETGISTHTATLAERVLQAMVLTKVKLGAALLVAVLMVGTAGALVCQRFVGLASGKVSLASQPIRTKTSALPVQKQAVPVDIYGDPLPKDALVRLGTMRLRHGAGTRSICFTHDGNGVLTAGGGNFPHLWDVATGKLLREFDQIPKPQDFHGVWIFGAVLSPDGRILAVRSGPTCNLYLVEMATGKLLHEFKCEKYRPNFAFSPDSKTIAAQQDSKFKLWEVATGQEQWAQEEKEIFDGLAFSPDGKTLASADDKGGRLWDARTGKLLRKLEAKDNHSPIAKHIAFSPDGKALAVVYAALPKANRMVLNGMPAVAFSSANLHTVLCEVDTGKEIRTLGDPDEKSICFRALSPDGKTIATTGSGEIRLWEAATGKELRRCKGLVHYEDGPLAFSPDGKLLAAMDGSLLRFWNVASGQAVPSQLSQLPGNDIDAVAFTPDGKTLISSGRDQIIRWWDAQTGRERHSLRCGNHPLLDLNEFGLPSSSKAILSPDGKILAAICANFRGDKNQVRTKVTDVIKGTSVSIRLYDAATGKELRRLKDKSRKGLQEIMLDQLAFSPDGKWLAAAGWGQSPTVQLWEVASGKRHREFDGMMPVFFPNGIILATVHEEQEKRVIDFWEVATGKKVHHHDPNKFIECLAFSPDGQKLAIGCKVSDGLVGIMPGKMNDDSSEEIIMYSVSWDKPSGVHLGKPRLVAAYPSPSGELHLKALAFSPDSRMLAWGKGREGFSAMIHVVEVTSGKERTCFPGHIKEVTALTFSADGRQLASGSADTTTLIWDVTSRVQDEAMKSIKFTDKALEGLWTDLAGTDATQAGRSMWTLVATGSQAVALLCKRLQPAASKASSEVIDQLIADLDAEDFKTRRKARHELEKLGEEIEPALRRALAKQPSLQMRRGLGELLSKLEEAWKAPPGDVLRGVRAVEVLERIGSQEACDLLKKLAGGALGFRLTHEAESSLHRLESRTKP